MVCRDAGDVQDFAGCPTHGSRAVQIVFRDTGRSESNLLDLLSHRLLFPWKVETAPVLGLLSGESCLVGSFQAHFTESLRVHPGSTMTSVESGRDQRTHLATPRFQSSVLAPGMLEGVDGFHRVNIEARRLLDVLRSAAFVAGLSVVLS